MIHRDEARRTPVAALAGALLVAGCVLPPSHEYAHTCPDGYAFNIRYSGADDPGDVAFLEDASGQTKLPRAPAASGARYSNGATVFRSKGDEAMILDGDTVRHQGCSTDPDQASSGST